MGSSIVNGKEITKNISVKRKNEILERQFILRCEIDINRIRKNKNILDKPVNRPFDILRYWEQIYISFREKLKDVTCYTINESLQKEFDQMNFSLSNLIANLKDKSVTEFRKFILEFAICILGVEKMYDIARVLKSGKARNKGKTFLSKLLKDYVKTENDQEILLSVFDKTLLQIK